MPIKKLKNIKTKLEAVVKTILNLNIVIDEVKINQGIILSSINRTKTEKNINEYEFKVFSQWGEDGIIQFLINTIDIKNRTFIEFGVEDFMESNCRFLLMKDNWAGFVIDGSDSNISRLKKSYFYWRYDLLALAKFITKDNINDVLAMSGFDIDLGVLSIDLDGNDYYVLEAIDKFKPRILICEFNAVFGSDRKISIPYQNDFHRSKVHHSNLYWGASLAAMTYLANRKGYSLVGTNKAGNNAFYVNNKYLNDKVKVVSVEEAYSPSSFRESRDQSGKLTYASGDQRLNLIKGLPVFEVEKNRIEFL